jgi:HEAT repeat protein
VRIVVVALFLLPATLLADTKPGDDGTPEYRAAADLVRQLGDARFAAREAAGKKLVEMGAAAVPALRAGTKSDDEEVRSRSAALLPKAEAVGWHRRADAFLADPAAHRDVPLLAEWEKLTGKPDAGNRKLFGDMLASAGSLLESAAADRKAAGGVLSAKAKALLGAARGGGKQVEGSAGEVAAVLFVQAVLKDRRNPDGADEGRTEPLYLLANPAVATALDDKQSGPAYRRLVVSWLDSRPADEHMSALYFALLAIRHTFPEADPSLVRLATKHQSTQVRWVALEALGRSRTVVATEKLTELLADKSTMYDNLGNKDTGQQVRDCALAALVAGKGKDPKTYGLTSYMSASFWFGGTADTVTVQLCGFETAAARERGIKKWLAEVAGKK